VGFPADLPDLPELSLSQAQILLKSGLPFRSVVY
jgi:hypothetical protein